MKLTSRPAITSLPADNLPAMLATIAEPDATQLARAFLCAWADLADALIGGHVTHVNIGLNQKRTSLLMTVNPGVGDKVYIVGQTAEEIVYNWTTSLADSRVAALLEIEGS